MVEISPSILYAPKRLFKYMENSESEKESNYYCNEKGQDITLFLDLGPPIDEDYIEKHRKSNRRERANENELEEKNDYPHNLMDDIEANYALKLIQSGLILYREPHLKEQEKQDRKQCRSIPDFYVYHPELKEGVLVEITQYGKNHSSKTKREQHDNLRNFCEKYNIPFIPLFREDLEMMGLSLTIKQLLSEPQ